VLRFRSDAYEYGPAMMGNAPSGREINGGDVGFMITYTQDANCPPPAAMGRK